MKVFLIIWISAVLIQEIAPSTLIRLPRNAGKNLSLVHTEYEAKYEQKGKHGNESFSTVSGKQQIVHDNCAENWNTFAEKCASLIKDLVASLANAVSSKPGDATNLQLHIKNTFRHFDNTHNCTCLNRTGKSLSDLDWSPLFNNITIKTVGPTVKNGNENSTEAESEKGGQSNGESFDEQNDTRHENSLGQEQQKQPNRALTDAEDLDMNPENADGSGDESTNNGRREIKYPSDLVKPRKLFKLSDGTFSTDLNPRQPEGNKIVRYPFLATARPTSQSAEPLESPAFALNPPSLSGQPNTELNSPNFESSRVSPSQGNSPAVINLPPGSPKSAGESSSASPLLSPSANGNSSPDSNYFLPAPQDVSEPQSFSNEGGPNEEVFEPNGSKIYQEPISATEVKLPVKSMSNSSRKRPVIIPRESVTQGYGSKPELEVLGEAISNKPENYVPSGMATDRQNSSPLALLPSQSSNNQPDAQLSAILPEDQLTNSYKSMPKKLINKKPSGRPIVILPEKPATDSHKSSPATETDQFQSGQNSVPTMSESSKSPIAYPEKEPIDNSSPKPHTVMPMRSDGSEQNPQSTVILPEKPNSNSHTISPIFIPEPENGPNLASLIEKLVKPDNSISKEQPIIKLPPDSLIENLRKVISEAPISPPNIRLKPPIIILPQNSDSKNFGSDPSIVAPASLTENNPSSELPEEHHNILTENSATKNPNSAPPAFIRHEKPIQEPLSEQTPFLNVKENIAVESNGNPVERELSPAISAIHSNANLPDLSGPANNDEIIHPPPIYDASFTSSTSGPLSKPLTDNNAAILTPENIDNHFILEHTTTYAPTIAPFKETGVDRTSQTVPEASNLQSGDSTLEKHLPITAIPGHSSLTEPESTSNSQQLGAGESGPSELHWNSQQPIQKAIFSTPGPIYPEYPVTVLPMADNHSNSGVTMENGDTNEAPVQVDQKQFHAGTTEDKTQDINGHAPIISPETANVPPVNYPPNEAKSKGEPDEGKENSGFANNENNADIPIQATAATENGEAPFSSHGPISVQQEQFGTLSPRIISEGAYNPEVTVDPDKILKPTAQPNSDQLQHGYDSNSGSSTIGSSDSAPVVISDPAESQPETAVPPSVVKPSQPGALYPSTEVQSHQEEGQNLSIQPTTFQTTSDEPTTPHSINQPYSFHSDSPSLIRPTTSIPQDSDETTPTRHLGSPKTTSVQEHDDDDEEDCCSCESCTEEEITDPRQYRESACKNLEEARKELKAIFDKIKKKLKCGRKAPQTITSS